MGKDLSYKYDTSTGAVVTIQWSALGSVANRKQSWGGSINDWNVRRVGEFTYLIPAHITVEKIDKALKNALLPSDRAVVTYPFGETGSGSSLMRIRLYGKAAKDALKP